MSQAGAPCGCQVTCIGSGYRVTVTNSLSEEFDPFISQLKSYLKHQPLIAFKPFKNLVQVSKAHLQDQISH